MKKELFEKFERIRFDTKNQIIFFLFLFLLFGTLSYFLGQDLNWDLLNYHYYGPYSLLNERLEIDCAPAQVTTYANPLLDLPFYYGSQIMKPWLVGFVLGGVHGINFFLLLILSYLLFSNMKEKRRLTLSLICAIVGVYAPMFILEFGTTFNDNLVSIFVLSGLILILKSYSNDLNIKRNKYFVFAAGCLIGFGVGLKIVHVFYLIAAMIAFFVCINCLRNKIKNSLLFFVGALVGLFASFGYWMFKMFKLFGSPLFPFYNNIFKSPWYEYINFQDVRFLPETFFQALFYPFYFALDSTLVIEKSFAFRDIRFAVIYSLIIISIFTYLNIKEIFFKATPKNLVVEIVNKHHKKETLFIYLFVFSYIIWQLKFSIYRYLSALELIAPIMIVLLIEKFKISVRMKNIIMFIILTLILISFIPPKITTTRWSDSLFDISMENKDKVMDNSIILFVGGFPRSYIIPYFDSKNISFVGINNNLIKQGQNNLLVQRCEKIILDNKNNSYLLAKISEINNTQKALHRYNLSIIQSENYSITTKVETLYLFKLK